MSELPPAARSRDTPAMSAGAAEEPLPAGGTATRTRPAARRRRIGPAAATPHSSRFRAARAILLGCAIGAVGVAVALGIAGRHSRSAAQWSVWSPPDHGALGAQDIADYLAPLYRATPTDQLAVVTVVNLENPAAAAAAAAASANGTSPSTSGGGLQVAVKLDPNASTLSLLGGNTVAFNLCGVGGRQCAIGVGQPSSTRLLLLRREALELALYTFRYISGTQNVVAILPPARPAATGTLSRTPPLAGAATKSINMAVLFQRQELAPLLKQPLSASLPELLTPTVTQMAGAPEAGLVAQATARGLFSESLQKTQDGSGLIVLDRLPPQ